MNQISPFPLPSPSAPSTPATPDVRDQAASADGESFDTFLLKCSGGNEEEAAARDSAAPVEDPVENMAAAEAPDASVQADLLAMFGLPAATPLPEPIPLVLRNDLMVGDSLPETRNSAPENPPAPRDASPTKALSTRNATIAQPAAETIEARSPERSTDAPTKIAQLPPAEDVETPLAVSTVRRIVRSAPVEPAPAVESTVRTAQPLEPITAETGQAITLKVPTHPENVAPAISEIAQLAPAKTFTPLADAERGSIPEKVLPPIRRKPAEAAIVSPVNVTPPLPDPGGVSAASAEKAPLRQIAIPAQSPANSRQSDRHHAGSPDIRRHSPYPNQCWHDGC